MGRIQEARHDGLLRRLFSIKGGGSLLAETLGDAFPVIQLEGGPIELYRLAGWEIGMGGASRTSGVGETVGWQLFNPAGSGKLVIPTRAYFINDKGGTLQWGVTAVALATATVGRQRDTREGVLARTVAQSRDGNDPTVPVGAIRFFMIANEAKDIGDSDGLAVLAPGTALTFVTSSTNTVVRYGFLWRERVAEPSELSF